jgi:A/G-specific adenine glycosylase
MVDALIFFWFHGVCGNRKLAAQLVDPIRPGDFNQALMELGATVCTPLNPSCSSCPASGHCRALSIFRHDSSVLVTDFPVKVVKIKQREDFSAVCVVELLGDQKTLEGSQTDSRELLGGLKKLEGSQTNNRFLLVKRPDEGLLAGLWEFPSVLLDGEADLASRRKAIDYFLKSKFGLDPKETCDIAFRKSVGEFVHIFSHIRLKIYVELLVLHLKGLCSLALS